MSYTNVKGQEIHLDFVFNESIITDEKLMTWFKDTLSLFVPNPETGIPDIQGNMKVVPIYNSEE